MKYLKSFIVLVLLGISFQANASIIEVLTFKGTLDGDISSVLPNSTTLTSNYLDDQSVSEESLNLDAEEFGIMFTFKDFKFGQDSDGIVTDIETTEQYLREIFKFTILFNDVSSVAGESIINIDLDKISNTGLFEWHFFAEEVALNNFLDLIDYKKTSVVPEPSIISLLGLGGIAGIIIPGFRRKH